MELDISRHKELFNPYYFNAPVTVIGCGATGSWLALMLAKLGIQDITVYDFDVVEEHNVPNQAYRIKDIGVSKVDALNELIIRNVNQPIKVFNEKFTNQRLAGIVFLMVDSMSARKEIWQASIKMKTSVKLLVEPRMGIDGARLYNVNPMNLTHIREYEDTYSYGDEEAEVSACGASKSVITTAIATASWCARQLINWFNEEELDNEILIDFKYNQIFATKW
jgi:hypothetical protein